MTGLCLQPCHSKPELILSCYGYARLAIVQGQRTFLLLDYGALHYPNPAPRSFIEQVTVRNDQLRRTIHEQLTAAIAKSSTCACRSSVSGDLYRFERTCTIAATLSKVQVEPCRDDVDLHERTFKSGQPSQEFPHLNSQTYMTT